MFSYQDRAARRQSFGNSKKEIEDNYNDPDENRLPKINMPDWKDGNDNNVRSSTSLFSPQNDDKSHLLNKWSTGGGKNVKQVTDEYKQNLQSRIETERMRRGSLLESKTDSSNRMPVGLDLDFAAEDEDTRNNDPRLSLVYSSDASPEELPQGQQSSPKPTTNFVPSPNRLWNSLLPQQPRQASNSKLRRGSYFTGTKADAIPSSPINIKNRDLNAINTGGSINSAYSTTSANSTRGGIWADVDSTRGTPSPYSYPNPYPNPPYPADTPVSGTPVSGAVPSRSIMSLLSGSYSKPRVDPLYSGISHRRTTPPSVPTSLACPAPIEGEIDSLPVADLSLSIPSVNTNIDDVHDAKEGHMGYEEVPAQVGDRVRSSTTVQMEKDVLAWSEVSSPRPDGTPHTEVYTGTPHTGTSHTGTPHTDTPYTECTDQSTPHTGTSHSGTPLATPVHTPTSTSSTPYTPQSYASPYTTSSTPYTYIALIFAILALIVLLPSNPHPTVLALMPPIAGMALSDLLTSITTYKIFLVGNVKLLVGGVSKVGVRYYTLARTASSSADISMVNVANLVPTYTTPWASFTSAVSKSLIVVTRAVPADVYESLKTFTVRSNIFAIAGMRGVGMGGLVGGKGFGAFLSGLGGMGNVDSTGIESIGIESTGIESPPVDPLSVAVVLFDSAPFPYHILGLAAIGTGVCLVIGSYITFTSLGVESRQKIVDTILTYSPIPLRARIEKHLSPRFTRSMSARKTDGMALRPSRKSLPRKKLY